MGTEATLLWILGTALAASSEDPRLVAATDGAHVWLTDDAGGHWRRLLVAGSRAELDELADDSPLDELPIDEEDDGGPPAIRALAFLNGDLLWTTPSGLYAATISEGIARRRTTERLESLAVDGTVLWATRESDLLRSDDGGLTFRPCGRLPDGPARSLAVVEGRVLVATARDIYLGDVVGFHPLGVGGGASVANGADGVLWRTSSHGVENSPDGFTWRLVASPPARALAVGAADVWLATGHRITCLREVQSWEHERFPTAPVTFDPAGLRWRGERRAWVPTVALLARAANLLLPSERAVEISLFLTWDLDATMSPNTAIDIEATGLDMRSLAHRGAR